MKHVVSVSLGSRTRDHVAEVEVGGEVIRIERRGTDGDVKAAIRLIAELDGQVDAFGLGGIDRYVFAGGRRYVLRDGERIARAARRTPIVDGSGLKDSLERWIVPYLQEQGLFSFTGKRVLLVAGVDRFGMAEALVQIRCDVRFGDLLFILGIPYPMRSLQGLARLARCVAPLIVQLPARWIYPTGEKQHEIRPKHKRFYDWADMIAGDFHLIKRYMPDDMTGKVVLTNTVTPRDVEELRRRGVATLITTTPNLGGRSFGTNVVEAVLVAISGRSVHELTPEVYMELLARVNFRPMILHLNGEEQRQLIHDFDRTLV